MCPRGWKWSYRKWSPNASVRKHKAQLWNKNQEACRNNQISVKIKVQNKIHEKEKFYFCSEGTHTHIFRTKSLPATSDCCSCNCEFERCFDKRQDGFPANPLWAIHIKNLWSSLSSYTQNVDIGRKENKRDPSTCHGFRVFHHPFPVKTKLIKKQDRKSGKVNDSNELQCNEASQEILSTCWRETFPLRFCGVKLHKKILWFGSWFSSAQELQMFNREALCRWPLSSLWRPSPCPARLWLACNWFTSWPWWSILKLVLFWRQNFHTILVLGNRPHILQNLICSISCSKEI